MFHISHKRLPTAFVIKYQQTILCNKNAHTTVCSFFRCLKKPFCFCYYCYFFSLRLYNIPTPFLVWAPSAKAAAILVWAPSKGDWHWWSHWVQYRPGVAGPWSHWSHCIHNFGIRKNPPLKQNNKTPLIFRGNKSNTSSRSLKIITETKTKPMRDLNADGDLIQLLLVIM